MNLSSMSPLIKRRRWLAGIAELIAAFVSSGNVTHNPRGELPGGR